MLIAVMADTYARVSEAKDAIYLKNKTDMIAEASFMVGANWDLCSGTDMVLLCPDFEGDDAFQDKWEGNMKRVTAKIERVEYNMTEMMKKLVDKIDRNNAELKKEMKKNTDAVLGNKW